MASNSPKLSIGVFLQLLALGLVSVQCFPEPRLVRNKRRIDTNLMLSKKIQASPVFKTDAGDVQGRVLHSREGNEYYAYLGN